MKVILVTLVLMSIVVISSCHPGGGVLLATFPAASSDTKVFRDALGNQATSYAYQDGHSSAVAVSRNDVSNHIVAAPVVYAPAPVVYSHPAPVPVAHFG